MARLLWQVLEDPQVYKDLQNNPHSFRFKEGPVVMVSTIHRPPHVELLKDHHGRLTITGPLANLMDAVAHSLNFTYKIVTPPDGTYGTHSANGSWSGMMGQVVRKSVKSGDLRDIRDLVNVGRIKYEVSSDLFHVVDTLVRDGDHTLATIKISLIKFISELSRKTGRCDFYIVRENLIHVFQCMVGQKGNPIVPAMSHRIRALVESGLYEYWLMSNIPFIENCRRSPSKITVMEPLALTNLWGMCVLLGVGHLLALLTFCLELCVVRCVSGRTS